MLMGLISHLILNLREVQMLYSAISIGEMEQDWVVEGQQMRREWYHAGNGFREPHPIPSRLR